MLNISAGKGCEKKLRTLLKTQNKLSNLRVGKAIKLLMCDVMM